MFLGRCSGPVPQQISHVFTIILSLCLIQSTIPSCLKSVPTLSWYPKISATTSHKDLSSSYTNTHNYQVAGTAGPKPYQGLPPSLLPSFNPHQFVYRVNRSTKNTIVITLQTTLSHPEHQWK